MARRYEEQSDGSLKLLTDAPMESGLYQRPNGTTYEARRNPLVGFFRAETSTGNKFVADASPGVPLPDYLQSDTQQAAPTPAPSGSGYVQTKPTEGSGTSARPQEKDTKSARLLEAGTSTGGSSFGILADSQPLGSTLDSENRYLRRGGAVLLR